MNKIKRLAFGILVAGLAFGFSAFTTVKKRSIIVYYQVDNPYATPSNPSGYVYFSEDRCATGGSVCSAQWDIGTHQFPTDGASLPTTGVTFQTGSVQTGHFE